LKPDPNVSVVICCYTEDRWDDIARAIDSVRVQSLPASELIIAVDHAPTLATRVRAAYPDAIVVENRGPRGLSGARNSGIDVATGDVVAFLDDDAVAAADWLEQLCAPYADDSVDGVGGQVLPQFDGARPAWFPPEFDWVIGCTYTGHAEHAGPIRNTIGANMSFRRRVFAELGGFDDRVGRVAAFPAGCEETEFCIRLRQRRAGAVVWYAPGAVVFHRVRPERTTFRYFRARCRAEGASKTRVSRMVGARDGLESERAYTTRTLPNATLRDVQAGLRGGSRGAWGRAGARVAGVAIAGGGFLEARVRLREPVAATSTETIASPAFAPILPVAIDLATGAPPVRERTADGTPFTRALVLVRDAGTPLGTLELDLPPAGLSGEELDQLVREHLGTTPNGRPAESASQALFSASSMFGGLPHVTVVVATRDRPEALRRCVDSILASRYPRFDIVVVDNAPASIATQRVVADAYGPGHNVRYVREPTPGLACAHNRALPEITSPIVAFTDDDVVVDPEWLANLVAGFGAAPDVACVTGMIFPLELDTPAQQLVERAIGFNKGIERRLYRVGTPGADVLFPYAAGRFGSGANMAFRTDVLRSLAGFDPALGTGTLARGGDDLAAFFDVVAAGHALVYEPAAVIFHAHRRDEAALPRQAFGYGAGLTAYLTKTVADRPGRLVDLVSRLPAGLRHALARDSEKNAKLPDDYPPSLVRRELAGMLVGPALYWRSRRATRHVPRPSQHPSGSPLAPAADGPGA
jgi:GT2 family glycosyltransferase